MVLGMHPTSLYPRRSRVAPKQERAWAEELTIERALLYGRLGGPVKLLSRLELWPFAGLTSLYSRPHNANDPKPESETARGGVHVHVHDL